MRTTTETKNLKKKNILVTGAAGYIGSMLCTKLVENGYNVTAVDILTYTSNSLNHLFSNKNFNFIKEDITKEKVVKKIIRNKNFIFPLAGIVGAPLCEKNKKKAINTNLTAIKMILKNIKKSQKIIFPTTNSGYGIGEKNKFCTEETPLNPISLYGRTKSDAEKEVLKHKNSISFRLATVFGCSYRMRTDLLVNNFVENAIRTNKLVLFEPYFRRNYIHILDVVRAFLFAMDNFNKMQSNIYNLGLSSANITKLELAKKIKVNLKKLVIKINKSQKDPDKRDYFVSNKKIEKLGFKALFSLDDGIKELINVFRYSNTKIINNY
jgi:nucleoside-diphosphate-sugar epimerase